MNQEEEKWMEDVFHSMKSSQRAKPRPDLFSKIEAEIATPTARVIPVNQWRFAAAAAVLILLVNISALIYYNQQGKMYQESSEDIAVADTYGQPLISTFQIYE